MHDQNDSNIEKLRSTKMKNGSSYESVGPFSQDVISYGLPYPKGLLLVGVQGTGKSIAAKIIAYEWQQPLLRLDFGRLFASLIGQSEQRVRKMIEIAEALSPCVLWVDEIDKAFAGAQSSGDSGTTSRVLASFITWLFLD